MNLKVLYGGSLSKEHVKLIEDLIEESPKNLKGSNLGTKVTRVALKRMLQDSTVSVVLLSEDDYKVHSSLSDDRLVCILNSDSIRNVFELKFGVPSQDLIQSHDSLENETDLGSDEEPTSEESIASRGIDASLGDDLDEENLSWDELINLYNKLGTEEVYSDDENDEDGQEDVSVITHDLSVDDDEELSTPFEVASDDPVLDVDDEISVKETPKEKALKRTIEMLKGQLIDQEQFLKESVSRDDYKKLKEEYTDLSENYKTLKISNEELSKELEDIKPKFKDLLIRYKKQSDLLETMKNSKVSTIEELQGRYPNVEFIVPLGSNSVLKMYEYISKLDEKFLFIDLTNHSYLDAFIKVTGLVKPAKWLFEGWDYRRLVVESKSHENIRVISSAIHELDTDYLLRTDWEKILKELAFESKVYINIGTIYDTHVIDVLKAVQHKVVVRGFIGHKSSREQRIGKLALDKLRNYRVLAEKGVSDPYGIITDRY